MTDGRSARVARMSFALGALKYLLIGGLLLLAAVFVVRGWQAMRGPPLQPWHLHVPDEPTAGQIDNMDWGQWMRREQAIFADVRAKITDKLPKAAQIPQNRYFAGAPMNPANLKQDWNRSVSRAPAVPPRGEIVLLVAGRSAKEARATAREARKAAQHAPPQGDAAD